MSNAHRAIPLILKSEGGFVNDPQDPGGATNLGVTIGTLRAIGMDLDGDGDVDVRDLKKLTPADAAKIYKQLYWDAVQADLLPAGVDYTVADFAINSGPARAAAHLQAAVGVKRDGHVGPRTLAAVNATHPVTIISTVHASRVKFLRNLPHWDRFGKGWQRRVDKVKSMSLTWAMESPADGRSDIRHDEVPKQQGGLWAALLWLLRAIGLVK